MMDQLGIQALRPGPSGDEKAPNHANYDESKANPYTNVPDPLTLNNGQKVTTPQMWWDVRRPQIVHDYEQYVYGRLPKNIPKVTWSVLASEKEMVGFHPVIATDLIGQVDNSSYPQISVNLRMTLVLPADVKGPVPVLIMFGPAGFPSPVQPSSEELARLNTAMKALLVQQDPSLKDVIAEHPGWNPVRPVPFEFPKPNADGDPPSTIELIAAGWGFATLDPQARRPTTERESREASSVWLTRASRANRTNGERCGPGRGPPAVVWIISKPIPQWMPSTSVSKECRVTAKRRW